MGTMIVGLLLLVMIALIIRSMIKTKKAGGSIICGGNCKDCSGTCGHQHSDRNS